MKFAEDISKYGKQVMELTNQQSQKIAQVFTLHHLHRRLCAVTEEVHTENQVHTEISLQVNFA